MPPDIIKVAKTSPIFPDWREDVTNGSPHPVLTSDEYVRIDIGRMCVDSSFKTNHHGCYNGHDRSPLEQLEQHEEHALKNFLQNPEIAWAVDNSFDGVYVIKNNNVDNFSVDYIFSVYLKRELATFWRLKYSGT